MIINTSFNVRGEPIVCTPEHAYRCFMATNMDVLVLENFLLLKEEQPDGASRTRRIPGAVRAGLRPMIKLDWNPPPISSGSSAGSRCSASRPSAGRWSRARACR